MEIFFKFLTGIMIVIFAGLLMGFPVMWLWNYLMPVLFGMKVITIWQAIALNLLSGILFKSNSSK